MDRRSIRRSASRTNGSGDGIGGNGSQQPPTDRSSDADNESESGAIEDNDIVTDGVAELGSNEPHESFRGGVVEVDPARLNEFIADNGSASRSDDNDGFARPRQRRKRGPNKSKASPQNIAPVLSFIHTWAAVILKTETIAITDDEAKQLSEAYAEFSKHHQVPIMSAKRMSEINMLGALGIVYGTRIIAAVKKNRKPKLHVMPTPGQQAN